MCTNSVFKAENSSKAEAVCLSNIIYMVLYSFVSQHLYTVPIQNSLGALQSNKVPFCLISYRELFAIVTTNLA